MTLIATTIIAAAVTSSNVSPLFSTQYVPGTTLGILHAPSQFVLTATYEVRLVSHLLNKETEAQRCSSGSSSYNEKGRAEIRTSSFLPSSAPSNYFSPGWTDSPRAWMSSQGVRTHCWCSLLRGRHTEQGPGLGAQGSAMRA